VQAISVRNIHKDYRTPSGTVHALRDVSFDLDRGALCAVVGPSGSGKSTLLSIIGGLDCPTSGEVFVGGVALHHLSSARRAKFRASRLGFVFQSNNLISVLTAAENVGLPLTLQGLSTRERSMRVATLLDELGLREVARQRPGELSGGQQQRVGIARALVTEPTLVLADEPTAHLDSETGAEVMSLLRSINSRRHTTFLFSTHDVDVESLADEHITLRDGAIVPPQRDQKVNGPCRPYSASRSETSFVIHAVR
jgi:putative ABC transport system ATP-binding protein